MKIYRRRCSHSKSSLWLCVISITGILLLLRQSSLLERLDIVVKSSSVPDFITWQRSFNATTEYNCTGKQYPYADRVEDILCLPQHRFLDNFKNPCWFETKKGKGEEHVLRCLPYFHIIGTVGASTTDLYSRMIQHPQIVENGGLKSKETWFWAWQRYGIHVYDESEWPYIYMQLSEFKNFFKPYKIQKMKIAADGSEYSDLITGHGDPMDFADMLSWRFIRQNRPESSEPKYTTPHLIKHILPNIKLVVILKEPITRLYHHYMKENRNPESFHAEVIDSITKIKECMRTLSLRACIYSKGLVNTLKTPVVESMYNIHMEEWLSVFPRRQIFILREEDYIQNISLYLRQIFQFLEIDNIDKDRLESILQMPLQLDPKHRQNIPPMKASTCDILQTFFNKVKKRLVYLLKDEIFNWTDHMNACGS